MHLKSIFKTIKKTTRTKQNQKYDNNKNIPKPKSPGLNLLQMTNYGTFAPSSASTYYIDVAIWRLKMHIAGKDSTYKNLNECISAVTKDLYNKISQKTNQTNYNDYIDLYVSKLNSNLSESIHFSEGVLKKKIIGIIAEEKQLKTAGNINQEIPLGY